MLLHVIPCFFDYFDGILTILKYDQCALILIGYWPSYSMISVAVSRWDTDHIKVWPVWLYPDEILTILKYEQCGQYPDGILTILNYDQCDRIPMGYWPS